MRSAIMTLVVRHKNLCNQKNKFNKTDPYYKYLEKEIKEHEQALKILKAENEKLPLTKAINYTPS